MIRAANLAFKGDDLAIAESHKQIRKHFEVWKQHCSNRYRSRSLAVCVCVRVHDIMTTTTTLCVHHIAGEMLIIDACVRVNVHMCVCMCGAVMLVVQESRGLSNEDEVRSLVEDAKEAAEVLRNLVVQSQIDEAGNLSTFANTRTYARTHTRDASVVHSMRSSVCLFFSRSLCRCMHRSASERHEELTAALSKSCACVYSVSSRAQGAAGALQREWIGDGSRSGTCRCAGIETETIAQKRR